MLELHWPEEKTLETCSRFRSSTTQGNALEISEPRPNCPEVLLPQAYRLGFDSLLESLGHKKAKTAGLRRCFILFYDNYIRDRPKFVLKFN
jgi:hypothetical protein